MSARPRSPGGSRAEATKFTEVGYVGRDVESIIRDLADAAIKMSRERAMGGVRHQAEDAAEDRILDILLRPARTDDAAPGFDWAVALDAGRHFVLITPDDCLNLTIHQPLEDVAYKPGVAADGSTVAARASRVEKSNAPASRCQARANPIPANEPHTIKLPR